MKRLPRILAAIVVLAGTVPALAVVSDEDISRARAEVNRIMEESADLGAQVQEAWARQFSLDAEITQLTSSIDLLSLQVAENEQLLEEVAVQMYMDASNLGNVGVLLTGSNESYEAGVEYLSGVSISGADVVNNMRSLQKELDRQTTRLTAAKAEQTELTAELVFLAEQLQTDLVSAQSTYETLVATQAAEQEAARRAEEERRRREAEEATSTSRATTTSAPDTTTSTAPGSATTTVASTTSTDAGATTTTAPSTTTTTTTTTTPAPSGGACPVAGAVSFTNTWGAPRSGGRTHQGVDMIAARNTPLAAIYAGTIKRMSSSSLGGVTLWLKANNGDEFYYAHLESYGDIRVGQSVPQGYIVGYNGSSGNAPTWLPHLHFEWHPGGGSAVNPYPLVKAICG